ncbi:hypothetical protein [Pseudohongiella sp. O18]|nr:hypothetical protein [Pseudohongiella sp. O18]
MFIRIVCDGFDLMLSDYDPKDVDDQEMLAEAFLLLHRRAQAREEA